MAKKAAGFQYTMPELPKAQAKKKPKPLPKAAPLMAPFTNEALINQQKAKYAIAQANNDYVGKRIANTQANKIREATNTPLYTSAVGDKQAAKTFTKTVTAERQNTAIQMINNANTPRIPKANKFVGQVVEGVLAPMPALKTTGKTVTGLMYGKLPIGAEDVRDKIAQTAYGKGMYGVAQGLSPVDTKPYIQRALSGKDITDSLAFKAGDVVGTGASFAVPYMGASEAVGKGLIKAIPQIAKLGKLGQSVAKSVATDLTVGLPLNVNYAYNKEGLRGKEALKSIAKYTALDVTLGAGIEGIGYIVGKTLKSGKKINSAEDLNNLTKTEQEEVMTELEQLAYESNIRKGKIKPNNDTIYGNSFNNNIAGELPSPKLTETPKTPTARDISFEDWRKQNFGGAFGKMSDGDTKALHELYVETTQPNYSIGAKQREVPYTIQPDELVKASKGHSLTSHNTPANAAPKQTLNKTPQKQYDDLYREFQANFKNLTDEQKLKYKAKFEELRTRKTPVLPTANLKAQSEEVPFNKMNQQAKLPYAENDIGIKRKLEDSISILKKVKPVSQLSGNEFPKNEKGLIENVAEFFNSLGNKVSRDGFGEIVLDRQGVKSSIGHGVGRQKAIAFASVPDVLKNGIEIDFQKNWKGRGYDTYLIAAPVKVGENTKYVGAVVKKDIETQKYYVHEVIDDIEKDGAELFKTGTIKNSYPSSSQPSSNSILQQPKNNVNLSSETTVPKDGKIPAEVNLNGQNSQANKLPNRLGNLYEKTVDSQHTIGKAVKGVEQTADKNAKILASNARNARGTADYSIKNGLVDMEGKQVARTPLQTVFESVPNVKDFNEYLLHKHNIDRFREGKPIFGNDVTSADSAEIIKQLERQYPQYKEFSGAVSENSNLLVDEWLVKGGLISKELGEKLKLKYKNYVPTYREGTVKADGYRSKGLKANTVVKTAVGGDKPVIAPNVSIGIQMQQAIKAVRKNEIYQGLLDAVRKDPQKISNYARLVDDTADTKYANTITKNAVDNLDLDDVESVANGLLSVDNKTGKYYVTAMENGNPIRMEVAEELFNSLKSLDRVSEGTLDSAAQVFRKYATNPFKALITGYNPFFALRNIARDIPTSFIQGTENNPLRWAKNLGDAAYNMAKNTDSYKEYNALGGKQSGYFNAEKGITSEKLPTKALRRFGEGISAFNEATETLPRFGEYLGTLKREGTDYAAKQQGIYNAGESTVNFARKGEYTKAADSFIPYLNPAVQGIDKSVRTFSNPKNVAKAIGMVSVPSAAIYALNHRTEEDAKNYAELDNRTKDTYFVFPTGGGEYIKIPKSREAGVLFSSLPERILRYKQGDANAFKGFGNTVTTNFAPQNPVEDNILAPATLNLAKNKDFANRAIVPTSMLNDGRSKYLQYDETTSELSKWLGDEVRNLPGMEQGLSPKQLDYLIDSYTGIIGDVLLPATTKGENPIENVLTKPFTADTVYNNEIQNTFYEDFDKATREKTDLNLTQDIPKDWLTPEEKKVSSFNKTSLAMGDIRKEINKQRANGASKDDLKELRAQLNDLAMNGSKTAEQVYQDYLKTYIPEISGMSDKQKEGYVEYAQPQGVSASEFNSAYKQAKEYRTEVSKVATILATYPENGEAIALGLGYSDNSIKNAKMFNDKGIETSYYEKYKQLADTNGDGKIKAKEAHDVLKNEDLTPSQRAYLIRILQGSALKEKN